MKLLGVVLLWLVVREGHAVTFDLSHYDPDNPVVKAFVNLTQDLTQVQVVNVPPDIGFYVIQVHSYFYNVTLSPKRKIKSKYAVMGTNVGLVDEKNATFFIKSLNQTRVLVVIVVYRAGDPVPGGCNLTFNTEIAPYQLISYTDDLIIVRSQAPSSQGTTCDNNNVTVDMYHLYLHENNYDPSYYYNGVEKMLTVETIRTNGYKVKTVDGYFKYRKLYSAYRGVGQVFAIIASYGNRSSAYVPAVSYGCDLTNRQESCNGPVTPHWKLICAVMLIFGLFVSIYGHKFFRITLYTMGFSVGVFITYVVMSFNDSLTVAEKTTTSMLIGLIYGSVWLLIWWKFGIPILSVGLTLFMGGCLIASIVFYSGIADFTIFHNDINFWLTFASIMVAFYIIWTMFTLEGHVFCCSFIGSYACVAALNYYSGGNLQYIVINTFRRIAVKNFNMATVDPPFQIMDISQTILWVAMTTFGFYYQMKEQRGKPPFPPHRYSAVEEGAREPTETTPLIYNNTAVVYAE